MPGTALGPWALGLGPTTVVETPARALEALVERAGDFRRQGAEARPLRLRVAHFLIGGAPARLVVFAAALPAGHGVAGQPIAPLLREQLRRRERRLRTAPFRDQLLDTGDELLHALARHVGIEIGAGEGRRPGGDETAERLVIPRRHVLLDPARQLRRLRPADARILDGLVQI